MTTRRHSSTLSAYGCYPDTPKHEALALLTFLVQHGILRHRTALLERVNFLISCELSLEAYRARDETARVATPATPIDPTWAVHIGRMSCLIDLR